MFTIPYAKRQLILAALTGVGKPFGFATLKVGLLVAPGLSITTRLARADVLLLEATFPGYTAGGVAPTAWGDQYKDGFDNVYQDLVPLNEFVATGATVDETVTHYFVDDGVNIMVEALPAPVRVKAQGDLVRVLVTMPFGQ